MIDSPTVWRVLPTPREVARAAAEEAASIGQRAVEAYGCFSVALSGGSTPVPFFELLASPTWRSRVPWRDTHVFWVDERCVPPDHPNSNFGLAERTLLRWIPIPQAQVHRIRGEADPEAAAEEYEFELRRFANGKSGPPLDLVFLGVGEDGHTASLFPGSEALRRDLEGSGGRWVLPNVIPGRDMARVTLTTAAINTAGEVVFLATGRSKAEVLSRIAGDAAAATCLPARLIRPRGPLVWLVDEEAAVQLDSDAVDRNLS